MSTEISIEGVVKRYDDKTIIPGLDLNIRSGEFFTLLGPSGCGKTTLLRMIAGFNSIEDGCIRFNGNPINRIPPHRRNIGMVFQNYAIFPHMSVRQNVEYGLKQQKMDKAERFTRATKMMEVVKITEYADKAPNQLSGGQQQRVALARAIVIHPAVLLMDEPLSNLDAKLRVEMRSAIREIQKNIDITTVYVTHDQEEALAVSDRIAVMREGILQQVGTPEELYKRPANVFVATFVGTSNIFEGVYHRQGGGVPSLRLGGGVPIEMENLEEMPDNTPVKVGVRPEEFRFSTDGGGLPGKVYSRMFLGRYVEYKIRLQTGEIVEVSQDAGALQPVPAEDEAVHLLLQKNRINVFDAATGQSIVRGRTC